VFDPDVAQQHALAAATAAFSRQTAQGPADFRAERSLETLRTKSSASRKSLPSQGTHFPPRGSSFRSQNAVQSGQTGITQGSFRRPTMSNDQKHPTFTSAALGIPPMRPLSAQLSNTLNENGRPSSQPKSGRKTAAMSITSQQIRKARSMYYASSIQTGSPIARPPAKYLSAPSPASASSELTAKATSSQIHHTGPSPLSSHRIPIIIEPHEIVDKARDEYLQAFQQRSVKHKPSLFLAPFRKRQTNSRERTQSAAPVPVPVPASHEQMPVESLLDTTLNDFLPQTDKSDKRSFSGSLKSKIRRVFKRTTSRAPTLPVQQIEASRNYFEANCVDSSCIDGSFDIPSPDDVLLQRIRSRIPSVEEDRRVSTQTESPKSGSGSTQSIQYQSNASQTSSSASASASASRVTSWGTSCTGDTLTQRAIKRLTVIHEAKDSIGIEAERWASASARRESLSPPTFTAFRDPMPMESLTGEVSTPPINPKRIFSALMREIDAPKPAKAQTHPVKLTPKEQSGLSRSDRLRKPDSSGRELHSSASKDPCISVSSEQRPQSSWSASVAAQSARKKSSIRSFGRAIKSTVQTVTSDEHRSSTFPNPSTDEQFMASGPQNQTYTPHSEATSGLQEREDEPRTTIFRSGTQNEIETTV
jgi:hypothetical protein